MSKSLATMARHPVRAAVILALAVALLALAVSLVLGTNVAGPNFEIEGNTAQDTLGWDDWETVIPGPGSLGVSGILIQDPHSKVATDSDIFKPAGKFGEPENWTIQAGNAGPAQNELTNITVYALLPSESADGDSWMVMSMERTKKQGTFDLDFELNQKPWDGTSGTLERTPGDVAIGFELKGNPTDAVEDLEVLIIKYDPANPDCTGAIDIYGAGWCTLFSAPASLLGAFGAATMNPTDFDAPPWGSVDEKGDPRTTIPAFQFAEAAINLTELGIEPGCPGFGSVHAKSRSSLSVTSDLKDLAGPVDLPVECRIYGHKYHDMDGDGNIVPEDEGNPLPGWTMNLYLDDGDGDFDPQDTNGGDTLEGTTTTCTQAQVDDPDDACENVGEYWFNGLSDGVYHVQEVCLAGWDQTVPPPTDGCGSGVHKNIPVDIDHTDQGPYDFGNARGSIIIKKVDEDGALLPGAGYTFDPDPFDGVGTLEILDGSGDDQANGDDGILCIDGVLLDEYDIEETHVPEGYEGDPATKTVTVDSSSTCAERLAAAYTPDATFTNLLGSIIIKKVDEDGALLPGAGYTFDPDPFDGVGTLEILDGSGDDKADGDDGVLCIDHVLLDEYDIEETHVPDGYEGDPDMETVTVDSASTCAERLAGAYTPDATFTNLLGSIIIRKEAKDARTEATDDLLGGATFRIMPSPFTGSGYLDVTDDLANDAFNTTAGLICIDDVRLDDVHDYEIHERESFTTYLEDSDTEYVSVTSASTCAERTTSDTPDALFENIPLSEIEVIFTSLAGAGVTKATIDCEDDAGNPLTLDSGTDDVDEVFSNLLPDTYKCTIVIDP